MVRGSFADLDELLRKKGYLYQYRAGKPSYSVVGKALFKNDQGIELMLKRIKRGKPAMRTGATVGLTRTAQQPDVWAVLRRKRR